MTPAEFDTVLSLSPSDQVEIRKSLSRFGIEIDLKGAFFLTSATMCYNHLWLNGDSKEWRSLAEKCLSNIQHPWDHLDLMGALAVFTAVKAKDAVRALKRMKFPEERERCPCVDTSEVDLISDPEGWDWLAQYAIPLCRKCGGMGWVTSGS